MFVRLDPAGEAAEVTFTFAGRQLVARAGDSLAAALLANGIGVFRKSPVGGGPRGPYCMMGVCFECLVRVDGVGNRQACMLAVREGMRVEPQSGGVEV